ncbi:MAG: dicarboxylate/amino acid:cation symporter [Gammaproteobacteria bacterium]|nr:dicarboxylate/amino acid:cation symporter [Gammaproteobacteria bacterium]
MTQWNPLRWPLYAQIFAGIALGVVAGLISGETAELFPGVTFDSIYDYIGTLFLNALKMLIVPLIATSIISGVAGLGGPGSLGRLGGKTVLYYLATSTVAVLVGLTLVNLVQPGVLNGVAVGALLDFEVNSEQVASRVAGAEGGVAQVFLRMFPPNIVMAAAEGQMLGVIVFCILFGYFISRLVRERREQVTGFVQACFEAMMGVTRFVMRFAPIGVFGLVAAVVANVGLGAARPLVVFSITVLAALAVHFLLVMPLILTFVARVNPLRHYRAMAPALLTAFSTASSSATLPITMRCVEDNAKVSSRTTGFVLPLGATVNMDGTALYECVAVMFIAQAYGLELGFGVQFTIVFAALLTSIGVAGVPAASFVAIAVILGAVGLPVEAIGVLFVFDRILDMSRTAVNVFGDSCGAVTIARLEGESGVLGEPSRQRGRDDE